MSDGNDRVICEIAKVSDDDQRLVYGFASIIAKDGIPTVDVQNDMVAPDELAKGAHGYMLEGRGGKVSHMGPNVMDPVESLVITRESSFPALLKALDIPMPDPLPLEGWWVGFRVNDDKTWQLAKSGDLRAFSIGGRGVRTPIEE